ncbi:MAG: class I SAM-dependent methyltransferase [Bacteroidales bacterium]|nr:class I SAM-dependent methyltransferase [Bacteroidales bacterium]
MSYTFQNKESIINRYPKTNSTSLKAWNTADELMLNFLVENQLINSNIAIYHDRFGFLSTILAAQKTTSVILYKSQQKAIWQNLSENNIPKESTKYIYPLDKFEDKIDTALIKIPKSVDLFELYMQQLSQSLSKDAIVIGSFMTKFFSKSIIDIGEKYFDEVTQSKAHKKARLIVLKNPKPFKEKDLIKEIKYKDDTIFKQYPGVFSAKNIDYATQFFMENLKISEGDSKILDLGSGNGVLAWKARQINKTAKINLLEDNYLAIESSKLNMSKGETFYHFEDDLSHISNNSYDLVISNPPFHFEHENNIEISINLFSQVAKILKPKGSFQLVGNKHLNYKTHLSTIFKTMEVVAENEKFVIYDCKKK